MHVEQEPSEDEVMGMAWWNGLTDRARALWLQRAGTAVPAAAWALFKVDPSIAFDIGVQEGQELARANADVTQIGAGELSLYLKPASSTRH